MAPCKCTVTVRLCPYSYFEGIELVLPDDYVIFRAEDDVTVQDMREHALNTYNLISEDHKVTMHLETSCKKLVKEGLIAWESASFNSVQTDDTDEITVIAHIDPKAVSKRLPQIQTRPTSSSQVNLTPLPLTKEVSTNSKRKAGESSLNRPSKKLAGRVAQGAASTAGYTAPKLMVESSDGKGHFNIVVAEMKRSTKIITYSCVTTFTINSMELGHCEDGELIDLEIPAGFQPDNYWQGKRKKQELAPLITAFVDGGGIATNGGTAVAKKKGMARAKSKHPSISPIMPPSVLDTTTKPFPAITPVSKARKEITVVAVFVNSAAKQDLKINPHVQIFVSPSEAYDTVLKLIMDGEGDFAGIQDKVDSTRIWWDTEVFVLPQVKGCKELYSWTKDPSRRAREFLCAGGKWPLELYMEVHIIPDAVKQKQAEEMEEEAREKKAREEKAREEKAREEKARMKKQERKVKRKAETMTKLEAKAKTELPGLRKKPAKSTRKVKKTKAMSDEDEADVVPKPKKKDEISKQANKSAITKNKPLSKRTKNKPLSKRAKTVLVVSDEDSSEGSDE